MKSISVSSIASFALRSTVVIYFMAVAAVLFACPAAAQTISPVDLLPTLTLSNGGSIVVPIEPPEKLLFRPLRSLASVVRGEQTVRTRNGIGFRVVNVRAQDEIWLVSARQQSQCGLTLQQLVNGQWVPTGMTELTESHALDQQRSSVIYVHGNRTDDEYARSRGLQFYENVFNGENRSGPVRFVIFAWRSEREKVRPSLDFNVKLDRSVELGTTFASFLGQFEDRRIVLSGFSLGAQVVLSGLAQLPAPEGQYEDEADKFRVALITPALKAEDALNSVASLPQNAAVAKTVVFINRKDNALRAAMLVAKATSARAEVTLEQIATAPTCKPINPVVIEDMTAQVTSCHSITKYSAKCLRLQVVVNEMADEVRGGSESTCLECEALQSQVEVAARVIEEPVNEEPVNEELVNEELVNEKRLD